jgi:nitroreductase
MMTKPVDRETLLTQLKWRYATKKFDAAKKIPAADWAALEEALVLTPSSYGLQPWRFLVVDDPALRQQLLPHSWNQNQVVDCSHYVVLAIRKHMDAAHVDRFIQRIAEVRGTPVSDLESYREMMLKDVVHGPRSLKVNHWAACQAYIALGNLMTAAALLDIDTCPMEGIEPDKYDAILGLPKRGFATVVACALGFRAEDDKYAQQAKIRFPREDVLEHL